MMYVATEHTNTSTQQTKDQRVHKTKHKKRCGVTMSYAA